MCGGGKLNLDGGNLDAAESAARQVLQIYAKSLPLRHLYVSATRHLLGEVLLRRGQLSDAETELRAALDIDLGSAGPGDWRGARPETGFGWVLFAHHNSPYNRHPLLLLRSNLFITVRPSPPSA